MSLEVWLVIATIAGPVLAVQAQKWVERATARKQARRYIFAALMANRATRLNDDFVKALNMIDLEFSPGWFGEKKDKAVIDAWRSLRGEYGAVPKAEDGKELISAWNQRINDRLVSLLFAISKAVGYNFPEEELRRGVYYPQGRYDLEQTQLTILNGIRQILEGKSAFPMRVTEIPASREVADLQLELLKKNIGAYNEGGAMRVKIEGDSGA